MPEWALVLVFVLTPVLPPLVGLFLLQRARHKGRSGLIFYNASIGGSRLLIAQPALLTLLCWAFLIYVLDYFLPFGVYLLSPSVICAAIFVHFLMRSKNQQKVELSDRSQQLLASLKKMQDDIADVRAHVEDLATDVQVRQTQILEGEQVKDSLMKEIDAKLSELHEWQGLTDKQREMVIGAAQAALNKRSYVSLVTVVISSIVLNLVANVIWSLMGQPGREHLLQLFENFKKLVP